MDIRFTVGDADYQLTSDKYNIILNSVGISAGEKTAGEERFTLVGYYPTEFKALESLVDRCVYEVPVKTFDELAAYRLKTLEQINEVARKYSLARG